jgi:phenylalanyl-tRNA synthetase beta chain
LRLWFYRMRLSFQWLSQWLDLSAETPQSVAHRLTLAGLEIEGGLEKLGAQFSGVRVASIVAVDPHPNADKLRLVTVARGPASGRVQVVCGAPNVAVGQRIAFAENGATVYSNKQEAWFQLQPAKIRGVASEGMICSLPELALSQQYPEDAKADGIWVLNDLTTEAQVGQPLEQALNLPADTILEAAPTANRGDWMSYLGVVRELSALCQKAIRFPETLAQLPVGLPQGTYTLESVEATLCPYYSVLTVKGVRVEPSPEWLRQALEASGIRSINNVVDITNYVMLETGQPLHAFDRAKLGASGSLGVRLAVESETLTTLDEVERPLKTESVVITFNNSPVALGGVMGGMTSAIDAHTQDVVLECAYFPSASTRRSARSVGLRTESSARYERGVDPSGARRACLRAAYLLTTLAHGTLEAFTENDRYPFQEAEVSLSLPRLEARTGRGYTKEQVVSILEPLGFTVTLATEETITVKVPSFRQLDVTQEADLMEEVLRIHGFDQVPSTLPVQTLASASSEGGGSSRFYAQVGAKLQALGLQEVSTPSLTNFSWLESCLFPAHPEQAIQLVNSHSQDHALMRQRLIPSLLEVCQRNLSKGEASVWVYELGKVYRKRSQSGPRQSGAEELLLLGGLLTGTPQGVHWLPTRQTDFYTVKGLLESFIQGLGIAEDLHWMMADVTEGFHPGQVASISWASNPGKPIGKLGQLHPKLSKGWKWKLPVFAFELELAALLKKRPSVTGHTYQLSSVPTTDRDISVLVPQAVSHQQLLEVLRLQDLPQLRTIQLFDRFEGNSLPEGFKSLAYRVTFGDAERTLTDAEADMYAQSLREQLQVAFPELQLR